MTYTDRSRHLELLRCPRARYIGYHLGGRGIAPMEKSIALVTGSAVHKGLEVLLGGSDVEAAMAAARVDFESNLPPGAKFQGQPAQFMDYSRAEQLALVEAILRVYEARALPALLADYKILSLEQEIEWPLGSLTFMSRLDGLLESRSDAERYVLSFKTDSGFNPIAHLEDFAIDLQGLTEPWAAGQPLPRGVKMEILVKGTWRASDPGSARAQDSFLVRPYHRLGNPVTPEHLAWAYDWQCPAPHDAVDSAGRKRACPGGADHKLGPKWGRVNIWEHMPMLEWIDLLLSGKIQPDVALDPVARVLFLPPTISRSEDEMRSRLSQVEVQETRFAADIQNIVFPEFGEKEEALDRAAPQDTATCNRNFGGKCAFHGICWPAAGSFQRLVQIGEDPEAFGFQSRIPNHPGEL